MPTAVPTIPPSSSGVSMTRSTPNSPWSPMVARKTPPNLPTSSPRTTTPGSRRISVRSASFTAWMRFSVGMSKTSEAPPLLTSPRNTGIRGDGRAELFELFALLTKWLRVDPLEERLQGRFRREGLGLPEGQLDLRRDLLHEPFRVAPDEESAAFEEGLHSQEGVLLPPRLHERVGPVDAGVVGRGVALHPVGDRLDERRPLPGRSSCPGAPRRVVDREEIVPIHALSGDAVGERLLGNRLRS